MDKKPNESWVSYIKRITRHLERGEIGYKEWGDYILGSDNTYSSENLRKAYYVINKLLPKFDGTKDITEKDIVNQIQLEKDELYKAKVQYQDARREYNKYQRAEARFENLKDLLEENMQCFEYINKYEFGEYQRPTVDSKHAILCLSDWHCGSLCDSQWNYYSVDEMIRRAENLNNKVKKYILDLRISRLAVEINGDMIEGLINLGGKVESEEFASEQIVTVSKTLIRFINSLKPYLQEITVVTTLGNHGRLTANKKDQAAERENFEMLIPEMLRMGLDKNILVITSHGRDILKYEFCGKTICVAHGHHDRPSSVIENFVKLYKKIPSEIHLGHYHAMADKNESGIYINVNGTLKGADEYAIEQCREVTPPSQNLIVYGQDRMNIEIQVN